jgi:small subunit ribosomal protein S1
MTNDPTKPGAGGEDFASLLAEYEQKSPDSRRPGKGPKPGDMVHGTIVGIGQDSVFIDLGGKSEGVIDLAEVRDEKGALTVQVGDSIDARVLASGERDGAIRLRRTLGRGARGAGGKNEAHDELRQAHELGIPVEGLVTGVNKGGVEVQVAGVRGFCPISQIEMRHVEDANAYVGQRLSFRITRFEDGPRGRDPNIVLSRRALLEEAAAQRASEARSRLEVGAVLKGTVTTLKDYGAFVDIGGVEGMLHVSEIGFTRIAHPKEVLAPGQSVEVQIKKIEKSDDPKRPDRISLSLKSLERDPWADATERFPEGASLMGKVVRLEPFGAFVELAPGVEGLLHISEMGENRRITHPRELYKVGDPLTVTVLGVDTDKRRISLGTQRADEADAELVKSGGGGGNAKFGTLGDLLKNRK